MFDGNPQKVPVFCIPEQGIEQIHIAAAETGTVC